jgi:hypothetical protein
MGLLPKFKSEYQKENMTVNGTSSKSSPKRRYPPFWEKAVPVFVVVMGVVILIMLVITIAVALGVFPTG